MNFDSPTSDQTAQAHEEGGLAAAELAAKTNPNMTSVQIPVLDTLIALLKEKHGITLSFFDAPPMMVETKAPAAGTDDAPIKMLHGQEHLPHGFVIKGSVKIAQAKRGGFLSSWARTTASPAMTEEKLTPEKLQLAFSAGAHELGLNFKKLDIVPIAAEDGIWLGEGTMNKFVGALLNNDSGDGKLARRNIARFEAGFAGACKANSPAI